jgi:hypothetical protein
MNRPIFTEAERQRQARKLSDALNECIREAFKPLTAEEKRRLAIARQAPRPITIEEHQAFRQSIAAGPADELDDLVADLRRVESENANHARRL